MKNGMAAGAYPEAPGVADPGAGGNDKGGTGDQAEEKEKESPQAGVEVDRAIASLQELRLPHFKKLRVPTPKLNSGMGKGIPKKPMTAQELEARAFSAKGAGRGQACYDSEEEEGVEEGEEEVQEVEEERGRPSHDNHLVKKHRCAEESLAHDHKLWFDNLAAAKKYVQMARDEEGKFRVAGNERNEKSNNIK